MRRQNLDREWQFNHGMYDHFASMQGEKRIVNLPHDYMIESDVREDAPAGSYMGYYTAATAHYLKKVMIPAEWEGGKVGLAFDGVMMNATIDINGSKVVLQHFGYVPFFADITDFIYYGSENRITITVNPSMQPNSRWYSGAGVFRSIELVHTPKIHIAQDGIYAYTKAVEYDGDKAVCATVQAQVEVCNDSDKKHLVRTEVALKKDADGEEVIRRNVLLQVNPGTHATAYVTLTVENPLLWDDKNPNLYQVESTVCDESIFVTHSIPVEKGSKDTETTLFGIRTVTADVKHGLQINGKTVKLKGGCLHHDNGLLGAVSLYDTEARKVQLLKDSGFNAIRTAHNPPSAVLMEACDRLGMYVFDEAFDAWSMGKQPGDYNMFFEADWEKDLTAFVKRDRTHPSVVIWSTGNEIGERGGLGDGYVTAMKVAEKLRELDATRPISNAICSFWNGLDDHRQEAQMKGMMEAFTNGNLQNADMGGKNDKTWEAYTEAFTNGLDIVGYNYLEDKYEPDHEMFPERVMLGSENYPKEIGFRWPVVESLPYVLGDFTWTAFDYLGEAGIGKQVFVEDGDPLLVLGHYGLTSQSSTFPWRTANDADFDITGKLRPQGYYRKVVWGDDSTYLFSYDPATYGKIEIVGMWGFTGVEANWNWSGSEEKPVRLLVFSNAEEVEVFQDGISLGRKPVTMERPLPYTAEFETVYRPGTLVAVSYRDGVEISRQALSTTGKAAAIRLTSEVSELAADGHGVAYVNVAVVDEAGNILPDAEVELTAALEGAGILAGFGSGNPITTDNYTKPTTTTYHGRAQAVLRSGYETGSMTLRVEADGMESVSVTIEVR